MALTSDRLERAVQSMHGIGMSLTTLVLAAISADKATSAFDLGDLSHGLLYGSLGFFVLTAVAGGHLITRLPLMDGELDDVMAQPAPLIGETKGLFAFKVKEWRNIQHWSLIIAVILGVAGALVTTSAEDLEKAKAAAAPPPAAAAPAATANTAG